MEYTLTIEQLISRPIIRNDNSHEFLNKMTDEEIRQWEKEIEHNLIEEGVSKKFPDWNAAIVSKVIDTDIIYIIIKKGLWKN